MDSFKAEDGEDDSTSVDSRESVTERNDDDVLHAVLLRVVVRTKADDGAESQAEGVEDLVSSIQPDSWLE